MCPTTPCGVVLEMIAQQNPGAKVEMNSDKYVDEKLLDELEREDCVKESTAKAEHGRYSSFFR